MKKVISGIGLLLVPTAVFLNMHNIAINNYSKINNWSISLGKYLSSLIETDGIIPYIISLLIGIVGFVLIFSGCQEKHRSNSAE